MIKTYMAHTGEVDDIEAALEEIGGQLESCQLLTHSVAILHCYADFVDSGVYEAVCKTLPCDVVGTTTMLSAVEGAQQEIALSLTVLTSDEVCFATGISEQITGEDKAPLRDAYQKALTQLSGPPVLALSYVPLLMNVGGDDFVMAFNEVSGGIPNFGTIAVDHNDDYHEAAVLYNGAAFRDRYAFVLLSGELKPRFYVANISNEKVFREKGVVTASKGNQLQTVNDRPVVDYLVSLGLRKNEDGSITGINSFPFIMDQNDGMMPVVRAVFALTPEGHAVCGGNVPVGATLSVGTIDATSVLEITEERISQALAAEPKPDVMLMYSCVGRYFSLGYNPTSEVEKMKELLGEANIPYHFAYSGCELCPVYASNGKEVTVNRSHNDTLVICAL